MAALFNLNLIKQKGFTLYASPLFLLRKQSQAYRATHELLRALISLV